MAQEAPVIARKTSRRLKIMLGVSLALNLAVVGLIAGAVLRGGPKGPPPSSRSYAAPYIRALPHADRRAIFHGIRKSDIGRKTNHAARRALYEQMLVVLRAEELDASTILAVLAQQKAGSQDIQDAVQTGWITLLSDMGLAERRAYADAVEVEMKRRSHKKRKP